jgi:hypothetical protein
MNEWCLTARLVVLVVKSRVSNTISLVRICCVVHVPCDNYLILTVIVTRLCLSCATNHLQPGAVKVPLHKVSCDVLRVTICIVEQSSITLCCVVE